MIKKIYELITKKPFLNKKKIKKNNVKLDLYKNLTLIKKYKNNRMMQFTYNNCNHKTNISVQNFELNKIKKCQTCIKESQYYLYFLLERKKDNLKIGITKNLIGRLTGNYGKKEVVGLKSEFDIEEENSFYLKINKKDSIIYEKKFHKLYKKYQLNSYGNIEGKTEWFINGNEILKQLNKFSKLTTLGTIYKKREDAKIKTLTSKEIDTIIEQIRDDNKIKTYIIN